MIVDLGALPWKARMVEYRKLPPVRCSIWLAYKWSATQQSVRG